MRATMVTCMSVRSKCSSWVDSWGSSLALGEQLSMQCVLLRKASSCKWRNYLHHLFFSPCKVDPTPRTVSSSLWLWLHESCTNWRGKILQEAARHGQCHRTRPVKPSTQHPALGESAPSLETHLPCPVPSAAVRHGWGSKSWSSGEHPHLLCSLSRWIEEIANHFVNVISFVLITVLQ